MAAELNRFACGGESSGRRPASVSVIVVVHNSEREIESCLDRVRGALEGRPHRVIVVDNASSDGTMESLRRYLGSIRVHRNALNVGFSAAVNRGAVGSDTDFILLLNPDVEIDRAAVETLFEVAGRFPRAGIYGGQAVLPTGGADPFSRLPAPSLRSALAFAVGLPSLRWRLARRATYHGRPRASAVRPVEALCGAVLLIDTRVWRELGGFDDRLVMYGEDVDFCWRARERGYTPLQATYARYRHIGGVGLSSAERHRLMLTSIASLYRRRLPGWSARAALIALVTGTAIRAVASAVASPSHRGVWPAVWRERRRWLRGWTPAERAAFHSRTQTHEPCRRFEDDLVLFVTTARNEVRFVDELVDGVLAQTRPPDRWVIVDDGSSDGTFEALSERVRGLDTVTLLRRDRRHEQVPDQLATGAVSRALNWALAHVEVDDFSHIGKLDADAALPAEFLERLLADFVANPRLGMTGGVLTEFRHGRWIPVRQPETHAPPPARLYTRDCFHASGGFREQLGWDTIDEVYARMRGFKTRVNYDVRVRHMRIQGSADGTLRGRARHGQCAWIVHYPVWFVLLRSLKLACRRPAGVSGLAFLYGYFAAMAQSIPQVDDAAFRAFVRHELRERVPGLARG